MKPTRLKSVTRKARGVIREFDRAARDYAWLGSSSPEEDVFRTENYKKAKTALFKLIGELERRAAGQEEA